MDSKSYGNPWDAVVVGGGVAGLSAAIYLGRGRRSVLVIDSGKSIANWAPDVENYLGFPQGIGGTEILSRGREQAKRYGAKFAEGTVTELRRHESNRFHLVSDGCSYDSRRVLLATGVLHVPPDIPGAAECIGHSVFFCKDCDGSRCEGKRVGIFGWNEEAAEYALGMLLYTPYVFLFPNGRKRTWSERHAQWLHDYRIPVFEETIVRLHHRDGLLTRLELESGDLLGLDAAFTTRGDVCHNRLAKQLDAATNVLGEITVDENRETNVKGLYAAGCVTPSNCQMIIAAGEGAAAAQAINRSLLGESLASRQFGKWPRRPEPRP